MYYSTHALQYTYTQTDVLKKTSGKGVPIWPNRKKDQSSQILRCLNFFCTSEKLWKGSERGNADWSSFLQAAGRTAAGGQTSCPAGRAASAPSVELHGARMAGAALEAPCRTVWWGQRRRTAGPWTGSPHRRSVWPEKANTGHSRRTK